MGVSGSGVRLVEALGLGSAHAAEHAWTAELSEEDRPPPLGTMQTVPSLMREAPPQLHAHSATLNPEP